MNGLTTADPMKTKMNELKECKEFQQQFSLRQQPQRKWIKKNSFFFSTFECAGARDILYDARSVRRLLISKQGPIIATKYYFHTF